MLLATGSWPGYFHNRHVRPAGSNTGLAVYLDVSGSVKEYLPEIIGAIAKTHLATKFAEALGKRFIAYDASKALFEDILGYPDIKKLHEGEVSYIPSKVTLWDKEFVFIDELNRALPEMQNKWLEIVRSRKIMGYNTDVIWVWSAMNPLSYAATQALDEALVGRSPSTAEPSGASWMKAPGRVAKTCSPWKTPLSISTS